MAQKMVYIYRVEMGKNGSVMETAYCYARNAKSAVDGFKTTRKAEKYDMFKAVSFADSDLKHHPLPFEVMPEDEVKIIKERGLGTAEKYSNRRDNRGPQIPKDAVFTPVADKPEEHT